MWIVELTKLNSSSNPVFHSIFRKLRKNKILKAKIWNIKFLLEIMKPAWDLYSQLLGRMKRKNLGATEWNPVQKRQKGWSWSLVVKNLLSKHTFYSWYRKKRRRKRRQGEKSGKGGDDREEGKRREEAEAKGTAGILWRRKGNIWRKDMKGKSKETPTEITIVSNVERKKYTYDSISSKK